MHSFPSSHQGSGDKMESMTEVFHGKFFPVGESCPVRIDLDHAPPIEETARRSETKKKSSQIHEAERIILPAIRTPGSGELSGHYLQMSAERDLQELDLSYMPSFNKAKYLSGVFDFTGPSVCQTDFESFTRQSLEVVLEKREEKMEESNALKRWEFWMRDKRRMQDYLAKRLQKKPDRLLLQDSDKIRRKLEEKLLSTCTQIPMADKWRGHPFRWKAEFRLPNRKIRWNDPKIGTPPEYCAIRTSLDKGEIPDTEFIGLPLTVQKEKGLVHKEYVYEKRESLHAEDTEYFKIRRRQLKPHDIDMNGLEVIGRKIIQPKEEPEETGPEAVLPEITVNDLSDFNKFNEDLSVFYLVIGKEEIKYNIGSHGFKVPSKRLHWRVDFALNSVGVLAERVLRVENKGTVAIRYHWLSEKPQKPMNLEKLQPRQYEPWFYFNKNSGFFLPGQIYHLKFYHHSKFSGIRKEVWHLITEPPLSLSSDPCTVTLSAIATEEFSSKNPLETYLFNRVKTSIVRSMIDIILDKALAPSSLRGIEYRSLFSNKILFEYNNPIRYYNSTIVDGLYKIYEKITPGLADWDLSLDTLIYQVKARRIGKERNSILSEVAEKAKLLLKPTYVSLRQDKKYRMTYAILCKMTNFMEDDYQFFRRSVSQKSNPDFVTLDAGEFGEVDYIMDLEINPINFLFFKTMFYVKVYFRMCQAVEHIAGMLETSKLFEPWKEIKYRIEKPPRSIEEHPFISNFARF